MHLLRGQGVLLHVCACHPCPRTHACVVYCVSVCVHAFVCVHVYVRLCAVVGVQDNCPPGGTISYQIRHTTAGGVGTFNDPVTFAGAVAAYALRRRFA